MIACIVAGGDLRPADCPQRSTGYRLRRPPRSAEPGASLRDRQSGTRHLLTRAARRQIDLQVGIISVVLPFLIGTVLGVSAGYYGGRIDTVVMRLVDVIQAFPFLILIIAIVAVLGIGLTSVYIAVALVAWVSYARLDSRRDPGGQEPGVRRRGAARSAAATAGSSGGTSCPTSSPRRWSSPRPTSCSTSCW